jgi:Phage tail assembly chaperone
MSQQVAQNFEIAVSGKKFNFALTRPAYNKFINSMAPNNKTAPSHNLLVSTVKPEDKDELVTFLAATPGSEVQLAGHLVEQYTPDLDIVVKKQES